MKFDNFLGDICASKLKKLMKGRVWEFGRQVLLIGLRKMLTCSSHRQPHDSPESSLSSHAYGL